MHLKVGEMSVTVYTSKDAEGVDEVHDDASSNSADSAELNEAGEEFTVP